MQIKHTTNKRKVNNFIPTFWRETLQDR